MEKGRTRDLGENQPGAPTTWHGTYSLIKTSLIQGTSTLIPTSIILIIPLASVGAITFVDQMVYTIADQALPKTSFTISTDRHLESEIEADQNDVRRELLAGTHVVRLTMAPIVSGRVLDEEGNPASSVKIIAGHPIRDKAETETDSKGRFALLAPDAGATILTAMRNHDPQFPERKLFAAKSIVVDSRDATELTLTLGAGRRIEMQVVDAEGQPIPDARVYHDYLGPHYLKLAVGAKIVPSTTFGQLTDSAGRVLWENAPKREMMMGVEAEGFSLRFFKLKTGQDTMRMQLTRNLSVSGTVTDANTGEPVSSFHVRTGWIRGDGKHPSWGLGDRYLQSCSKGRYRMSIDRERKTKKKILRVAAEGYEPAFSPVFECSVDDFEWNVALKPGRPASVAVLTPQGDPAPSADVALLPHWEMELRLRERDLVGSRLRNLGFLNETDSDGVFTLPAGDEIKQVAISHESGFAIVDAAELRAGNAIGLQPWGRIEGVIEGTTGSDARKIDLHVEQTERSALIRTPLLESNRFVVPFAPAGAFHLRLKGARHAFQPIAVNPGTTNVVKYSLVQSADE